MNVKVQRALELLDIEDSCEKIIFIFEDNHCKYLPDRTENGDKTLENLEKAKEISISSFSRFLGDFAGFLTQPGATYDRLFETESGVEIEYLMLSVPDGFFTYTLKNGKTTVLNISENIEKLIRDTFRLINN